MTNVNWSEEEIRCANCTIEVLGISQTNELGITHPNNISTHIFKKVITILNDEGLVETIRMGGWHETFKLTSKGHSLFESKKGIEGYLKDNADTKSRQMEKEQRDDYFRTLQIKDLEEKLNVMNVEQRDFWKAQKQKNLQTTLIAIISALFSLVALMKTWGFFD